MDPNETGFTSSDDSMDSPEVFRREQLSYAKPPAGGVSNKFHIKNSTKYYSENAEPKFVFPYDISPIEGSSFIKSKSSGTKNHNESAKNYGRTTFRGVVTEGAKVTSTPYQGGGLQKSLIFSTSSLSNIDMEDCSDLDVPTSRYTKSMFSDMLDTTSQSSRKISEESSAERIYQNEEPQLSPIESADENEQFNAEETPHLPSRERIIKRNQLMFSDFTDRLHASTSTYKTYGGRTHRLSNSAPNPILRNETNEFLYSSITQKLNKTKCREHVKESFSKRPSSPSHEIHVERKQRLISHVGKEIDRVKFIPVKLQMKELESKFAQKVPKEHQKYGHIPTDITCCNLKTLRDIK